MVRGFSKLGAPRLHLFAPVLLKFEGCPGEGARPGCRRGGCPAGSPLPFTVTVNPGRGAGDIGADAQERVAKGRNGFHQQLATANRLIRAASQ